MARRLQTTCEGIDDRWSRDIARSGNAGCTPEPARLELGAEGGLRLLRVGGQENLGTLITCRMVWVGRDLKDHLVPTPLP